MGVQLDSQLPKYEWLRRKLLDDINGMSPHAPLPPERDIATSYGVSRATVRQALDALESAALVYRVQGAGTFISPPTISKSLSLTSFSEDMIARGLTPSSRLLTADEVPAGKVVADELDLDPAETVIRLSRVRLADDVPMCVETAYLPSKRVPGLLDRDLSGSLYEVLTTVFGVRIMRAEQVLQALVVEEPSASLLSVGPGSAAMSVRRTGFDDRETPAEYTTSLYRADRYDIRFAVRREP